MEREIKKAYIGVDPGKAGFFTIYANGEFSFFAMPEHKIPTGELKKNGEPKMKPVFFEHGFRDLVFEINRKYPLHKFYAVIEDVHGRAGWSATNNFNFGHTAGLQKMILIMLDATTDLVRPQKWQSLMYQGFEKIMVPSSTGKTMVSDTKATSEMVAKTLAPNIDFRKTERAKNLDDNKTDSFLMCLYLLNKHKIDYRAALSGHHI